MISHSPGASSCPLPENALEIGEMLLGTHAASSIVARHEAMLVIIKRYVQRLHELMYDYSRGQIDESLADDVGMWVGIMDDEIIPSFQYFIERHAYYDTPEHRRLEAADWRRKID